MRATEHIIFGSGAIGLGTYDALQTRCITPRIIYDPSAGNKAGGRHKMPAEGTVGESLGDVDVENKARPTPRRSGRRFVRNYTASAWEQPTMSVVKQSKCGVVDLNESIGPSVCS